MAFDLHCSPHSLLLEELARGIGSTGGHLLSPYSPLCGRFGFRVVDLAPLLDGHLKAIHREQAIGSEASHLKLEIA